MISKEWIHITLTANDAYVKQIGAKTHKYDEFQSKLSLLRFQKYRMYYEHYCCLANRSNVTPTCINKVEKINRSDIKNWRF